MKRLDDQVLVAGHIRPEQLAELKAAGLALVVNNRPDGEAPGQPTSAEIGAAAEAAGLAYRHIPIRSGFSPDQVEAMADALGNAGGPVLAFCLSGTRSTFLWALARARQGEDGEALIARAAAAGYDLSAIRTILRA